MSLLEQAKRVPRLTRKRDLNPEIVELAVAYVRDEVNCAQVMSALGIKGGSGTISSRLMTALKHGWSKGWLYIDSTIEEKHGQDHR